MNPSLQLQRLMGTSDLSPGPLPLRLLAFRPLSNSDNLAQILDSSANEVKSLAPASAKIMFSDRLKAKPLLPVEEIFPAKFCIPIPPGRLLQRHSCYKAGGPKGKELGCKKNKNRCAKVTGGDLRWTSGCVLEAQVSLRPWEGGGRSFQGTTGFWLPQGSCPHLSGGGGRAARTLCLLTSMSFSEGKKRQRLNICVNL